MRIDMLLSENEEGRKIGKIMEIEGLEPYLWLSEHH